MVVLANIIIPLYIYPLQGQNKWQKLTDAAIKYPDITFTAVINPNSGPDPQANGCPTGEYVTAINNLTTTPNKNIRTMGYVHTANQYNCGPYSNYICPCSRPIEDVKAEITTYKSWATLNCQQPGMTTKPDIHMDSLFIDESPGTDGGANLTYMTDLTNFAKSPTTGFVKNSAGGTVLFNAGAATDLSYFNVADTIVILENSQEYYENNVTDIDDLNGNGEYYDKSSVIMYGHTKEQSVIRRDVQTILSKAQDAFESLYLTDLPGDGLQYSSFPSDGFWTTFLAEVNRVAQLNKQYE
jgi:hypothetical protein